MLADSAGGAGFPGDGGLRARRDPRDRQTNNRANLLASAEAWLAANKPDEALKIADEILAKKPTDGDAQNLMRKASVAQTVVKHSWESQQSYREKLRDEAQAVSLEQSAKVVTADTMTQRLLDEALARVAKEPNNLNHYRSVSQAYKQLGNLEQALAWIRKAPSSRSARTDACAREAEGELATARSRSA